MLYNCTASETDGTRRVVETSGALKENDGMLYPNDMSVAMSSRAGERLYCK